MRSRLTASLLALTLPALAGCAALGVGGEGEDGELSVAASFYPLAWVSERVSGREVDLLTTPGAEPHDFELTVRETALVADADLVVFERGFQPAVDTTVDEVAEGMTLDAAEAVELRPTEEHEDEHADEDEGHEHEHGALDPHFWLDPLLMADLGDAVADALVELDPAGEDAYRDNAAQLRSDLEELDTAYAEGLTGCERTTVVVSHDAFSYLERYGIELAPIAGLSPDAEATPAHLAELQELVAEEGITTVFAETLGSSKMADTLASDLGLETSVLDPIEGVADDSDDDYETIMRDNLEQLRSANGC